MNEKRELGRFPKLQLHHTSIGPDLLRLPLSMISLTLDLCIHVVC